MSDEAMTASEGPAKAFKHFEAEMGGTCWRVSFGPINLTEVVRREDAEKKAEEFNEWFLMHYMSKALHGSKLRAISAACGIPDKGDALRTILKIVKEAQGE